MPGMDGTEPMCLWRQTGRGMGICRNTSANAVFGCGRGFRRSCSNLSSVNAEILKLCAESLEKRKVK